MVDAFRAAHLAGLPAVALGNFTWDWIYAGYPEALASAPDLVPAIRRAYSHASLALRLPMHGGFDNWHSPIVDLPFVARHSAREPGEVRARLGVPEGIDQGVTGFNSVRSEPGKIGIASKMFCKLHICRKSFIPRC